MSYPVLFVEGKEDKKFVECLIQHLGLPDTEIIPIVGGVSKLPKVENLIHRYHDEGRKIAIILDADADFKRRRKEFFYQKQTLNIPVDGDSFFLMPNNRDSGCLENLLEAIAAEKHKVIHHCFSKYEDCLLDLPHSYTVPGLKAKIYAYCEALGIEPKPEDRDYADDQYWNLEEPALDGLKEFLGRFVD